MPEGNAGDISKSIQMTFAGCTSGVFFSSSLLSIFLRTRNLDSILFSFIFVITYLKLLQKFPLLVPLDDFLFQENVGHAIWGNSSKISHRSAIRKAALIKEMELKQAPSQIRRTAEETATSDNDMKMKQRVSSKLSDISDGHTSDGDLSSSTSEGFYNGHYCDDVPSMALPASSAPDCYPINTRGRGYTDESVCDVHAYTEAVSATCVEIHDASKYGSIFVEAVN